MKNGTSLGLSNHSKGEIKLQNILKEMQVNFQTQKWFNNCRNPKTNYPLRFDFYLPDYNCCIEYNGLQHYQETNYFSSSFIDQQYKDNIKRQYCKENNLKLIEIPYTDYDKINKYYIKKLLISIEWWQNSYFHDKDNVIGSNPIMYILHIAQR